MTKYTKIKDLLGKNKGEFLLKAVVKNIKQTRGPTLFVIEDETGSATAIAFKKPGQRAFESIQKGMFVELEVFLESNPDRTNIVIKNIFELSSDEYQNYQKLKQEQNINLAKPENVKSLIKTMKIESMYPTMNKIAFEIRKAVIERKPIWIKYHGDLDGYTSAILIENAIQEFNRRIFKSTDSWYVSKTIMKTPFYTINDALKDISIARKQESKQYKKPLLIFLDNGSTEEDLLPLMRLKSEGLNFIIIDHHIPSKFLESLGFSLLNPYSFNYDKNINTSILALEISHLITSNISHLFSDATKENMNIYDISFLGSLGDKSEGEEINTLSELTSVPIEKLKLLAKIIDYELYNLYNSDENSISELIFNYNDNKEYINSLYNFIVSKEQNLINSFDKYNSKHSKDNILIFLFDISLNTLKNDYPPMGKASGVILEYLKTKTKNKNIYIIVYSEDTITLRIHKKSDKITTIHEIISHLKKHNYIIEGGGHDIAGTIRCTKSERDSIIENTIKFILD